MKTKDCICMPLCVKHDCPRPCPICDKELFDKKNNWLEVKMYKLTLIIILVMLLPTVTALYGGETWSYYFPYCNKLIVNITGELQIDDEEYLILNNCTEISPNNYVCNCGPLSTPGGPLYDKLIKRCQEGI